jgi:hypothetical protein
MKEIYKALMQIQNEIEVPKERVNSFGKYKYRNAEDILEAAKPICQEHGCGLIINDKVVFIAGRFYVKATATLVHSDSGEYVATTAYAREASEKKGMDEAQITGATSSYARKYALNGLFCIDDTKDADSDEHHNEVKAKANKATAKQALPKIDAELFAKANEATNGGVAEYTAFLATLDAKTKETLRPYHSMLAGKAKDADSKAKPAIDDDGVPENLY